MRKGQIEFYHFSGDEEMNTTLGTTDVSDQTSSYDPSSHLYHPGVVRLTSTAHGFKVGADQKHPTHIYVQGSTNYDGLRRIVAVAADTLDIVAKYVAETPGGSEILRPALKFSEPWLFLGYRVHLDAASATSENLVISIDAAYGAAWDYNIVTKDMNAVQDTEEVWFADPELINAEDIVYATWVNTNDTLWGLTFVAQRLT